MHCGAPCACVCMRWRGVGSLYNVLLSRASCAESGGRMRDLARRFGRDAWAVSDVERRTAPKPFGRARSGYAIGVHFLIISRSILTQATPN